MTLSPFQDKVETIMYIMRANEKFIFDSFDRPFISALLGPRRVGKTTLVKYYMALHPGRKWITFNMDILSQRNRIAQEELELMIEESALQRIGRGDKIWIFIDEAQKSPELFDQIKIIYDTFKERDAVKFILTGSAHLNLHKVTTESLAGRVELLNLREFNLKETVMLKHSTLSLPYTNILEAIVSGKKKDNFEDIFLMMRPFQKLLEEALLENIIWGGLPEVINESTSSYRLQYLGDYLQTYLEKDIRSIDSIGDINLYNNFLKISAEQTGSIRNDAKVMEALHCSRNTLLKYRGYLSATLQYMELFPYIRSSLKRLVKTPKGYIINNGLISYLTGIHDTGILTSTGFIGHRFENWFLNEIQTWLDTQLQRSSLYYWRTHAGAEIDVIIELGRHIVPVEITYSSTIDSKKLNNLTSFLKEYPEAPVGIFCYTGKLAFDKRANILYVPAWLI
jgi:hypothetical protein